MPPSDDPRAIAAIQALTEWAGALVERGRGDLARRVYLMAAEAVGVAQGLQESHRSGNVGDMVTSERLRHSRGSASVDPLKAAANDRGYTIRSLAEKINVSHALLSKARKGERSIERALAEEIQKLTGFAATKKNWPGLKE